MSNIKTDDPFKIFDDLPDTEKTSAALPKKERQRNRIGTWGRNRADGFTCDEAEVALGLTHQACSARFTELKKDLAIVPTGLRRPTRTGRYAKVYVFNRPGNPMWEARGEAIMRLGERRNQ